MLTLFKNGKIFEGNNFAKGDILTAFSKILKVGKFNDKHLLTADIPLEIIDCQDKLIIPGLIDPHIHLTGGSGEEGGFITQTPAIFVSECLFGGITTVVGTIGVDTTTRSMSELIGRVKAFNEVGISAFAYTGGYDMPPRTMTKSVRDDVIFLPEVIGVGEVAIADHRAPEPNLTDLARASIDAHVGGLLSNKPGVTHFHVGGGKKKLSTVRKLLEEHEIFPENLYLTHVTRTMELFREAVELTKKGCFIDMDIYNRDVYKWSKIYHELGGPPGHFTFSSDAGVPAAFELWESIKKSVLEENVPLQELLCYVTSNTANALKLKTKAHIREGFDADLVVLTEKDLEITDVIARGKRLIKNSKLNTQRLSHAARRGLDIYGIVEK